MKRFCGLVVALSLLFVLVWATAAAAIEYPKPYGVINVQMQRGWFAGGQAWYYCFATNDIGFARDMDLSLVYKLGSAAADGQGASRMYFVTNANNNGVVFSTGPGFIDYSGLWDVQFVTWRPGVVPWVIMRTDIVGAPPGLPDATQADIVDTNIILDCPILALGPLGGPWLPAPPGTYRIKQAIPLPGYQYNKTVKLPLFEAFCRDPVHKWVENERATITDVTDPLLAAAIGANLAPGLLDVDEENRQAFWFIEGGPYNCQKPVMQFCPQSLGTRAVDYDYSPVMNFIRLGRNLPPATVVNNPDYLLYLLGNGYLFEISNTSVINANVVLRMRVINGNGT